MKVITERDKIRKAFETHCGEGNHPAHVALRNKLAAFDPETITREQLVSILRSDGELLLECSECNQVAVKLVQVGEEPDWESDTAYLCQPCLEKALAQLGEHKA